LTLSIIKYELDQSWRRKPPFGTGSTGFVGLNLVEQLTRRGWRVIALHRPDSDTRRLDRFGIEHALGDVVDLQSLLRAMPQAVDAVFHVAGLSNMWARRNPEQTRVNVEGTRYVVQTALARGARKFVFCSSWVAYGVHPDRFNEEAAQLGGQSWVNHFKSKYLSEQEVRAGISQGLDACIINPSLILGPGDTQGWARIIQLVHARRLPGVPPGRVNFCDVREVANAHIAAAEVGRSGQNYLLGGPDTSFVELVQIIGAVTGRAVPAKPTPAWVLQVMGRLQTWASAFSGKVPALTPEIAYSVSRQMSCDSTRAERELGYRVADLRSVVQASYQWLVDEGLLIADAGDALPRLDAEPHR